MPSVPTAIQRVALLVGVVFALAPAILYWHFVGRVPSVSPEKAKQILSDSQAAVLVDVSTPSGFKAHHLEAAQNWPMDEIAALSSQDAVPERFRGKQLLMMCESGILSAFAVQRLHELGIRDVANVDGGLQTWISSDERPCSLGLCRMALASGQTAGLPFRDSSGLEQWAMVLTGFVIKPVYTVLALAVFVVLWRQKSADLAALRWAMLAFFIGENFCAANYLVFNDRSHLFEYLHSLGMVFCFGLTTFALLEGIDHRLVKFSDAQSKCEALGLCRRCIKYTDVPCGLKRVFLLLILALIVLCGVPLAADFTTVAYNTKVLGTFYNFGHRVVYQIFEIRYLPVAAIVLLSASLGVLMLKKNEPVLWSKLFLAAGAGALGFSYFRLVFVQVYRDNLAWFSFWEEITELIFVAGAGLALWFFRHGLFAAGSADDRSPAAHPTARPQT
jgi:rhodanese-related sulfurtransferase